MAVTWVPAAAAIVYALLVAAPSDDVFTVSVGVPAGGFVTPIATTLTVPAAATLTGVVSTTVTPDPVGVLVTTVPLML